MGLLTGKTAIVTGAARGIGKAIALKFAAEGANIAFTDLVIDENGENTEKEIAAFGVKVKGYASNAASFEDTARVVEQIKEDFGSIDILVNNAGITKKARAEVFPMDDFKHILDVDVTSLFALSQICYPYLKESKHKGRIINISSMAAHLGFSEVVPYCVSKSAVCGLTRGLAIEWANDNICVNSIAPGWFPSEMNKQVMTPERKAAILARMPVHAFGDTRDLGAMAKFLISDGATYITGQDFAVDGGALAYGF